METKDQVIDISQSTFKSYKRGNSISKLKLAYILANFYGENINASIQPSGMATIKAITNLVVFDILKYSVTTKTYILVNHEVYCDTHKLFEKYTKIAKNLQIIYFDTRNHTIFNGNHSKLVSTEQTILEFFTIHKNNIWMMFVESCTNPSGTMMNFNLIHQLKKINPQCLFVCDNTWLTIKLFNPFDYEFDVVCNSMTKYYSGGTHIIGCILYTNDKKFNGNSLEISIYYSTHEYHIADVVLDKVISMVKTLPNRIKKHEEKVKILINFLNQKKIKFMHPMHISHPTYSNNVKFLKGFPGIVWTFIPSSKISKKKFSKVLKNLPKKYFTTSYGKPIPCIDPWPKRGKSNDYDFSKNSEPGTWIRISTGYDYTNRQFDEFLKLIENLFFL